MKTVGQALVSGLAARGVEVVFGIPGVHTIELYRGLAGSGIRHVTPRHEQGAAFMADGYARVSGKPGVAFVITGPGLTNALTAMAQARADSVPILVISGVNRRASLGRGHGHLHELPDQAKLVAALCPTFQVTGPEALDPALEAAFAALRSGRPGPVHLEVPTDVMGLRAVATHQGMTAEPEHELDSAELNAAVRAFEIAERPVILCGGGAWRAEGLVQDLAERLDAPVVMTVNARGVMHGHPLSVPASPSLLAVRGLIESSDQVIALGTELGPTDYDMYATGEMPDLSGMIRVDICAGQLARHPAAIAIHSPVAPALRALLTLVGRGQQSDGAARAAATMRAVKAEIAGFSAEVTEQITLLEVLRDAMPGGIVVGDSTQPVYAGNLCYSHDRAGGWFNAATGFGALGFAPGAAVGAALAAPGVPVVCLIGDGGLQFSPAELRVAVDERLLITYLVWNNSGYGEIAQAMRDVGMEVIGCDPSPLRLEPFAAACDMPYLCIRPEVDALKAAIETPSAGPRLIEVRIA